VDIREYIESGKLEAYLLGALQDEEALQVAADIAMYPELATECRSLEATMLQYHTANARTPNPALQDRVWNTIANTADSSAISFDEDAPAPNPKQIPLTGANKLQLNWKIAAGLILLAGSIAMNLLLMQQRSSSEAKITALATKMDSMQAQQLQLASIVGEYRKATEMMADTGVQTIVMHTILKGHPMAATLYISKTTGEAFVAMDALPEPPKGMQYQMWAIKDGKPMDMGMLASNMANTPAVQRVAKMIDGQAFAISLEKEGGSPTPTAENIYVLGKAS